jgi:hypothetical protein
MPLVVKARYRQGNHERAQLLETVFEVMRRKDPEFGADDYGTDQVGMHELRAALAMTRQAANALCALAQTTTGGHPAQTRTGGKATRISKPSQTQAMTATGRPIRVCGGRPLCTPASTLYPRPRPTPR